MQVLPALEEAWGAVIATLEGLAPDDWDRPTPCPLWSVRDIAAHLGHVEGTALGFPQPEPPADFDAAAFDGLDLATNSGVAARRAWSTGEVLDEIRRSSAATLERLWNTGDEGWREPHPSPVGMVPLAQAMEVRLADVYVHLLDIRHGLGRPLSAADEPIASAATVGRAVRLTGWAAVKRAELPDGARIRLSLTGPAGRDEATVAVSGGRGLLAAEDGETTGRIEGTGLAYLLAAGGRRAMAEAAGGLTVTGDSARRLIETFRLFG